MTWVVAEEHFFSLFGAAQRGAEHRIEEQKQADDQKHHDSDGGAEPDAQSNGDGGNAEDSHDQFKPQASGTGLWIAG